jgi:hypothetical protein
MVVVHRECVRMNSESKLPGEAIPERNTEAIVDLIWESGGTGSFQRLLSHGVLIKAQVPATIRELLCVQFRVGDEYLDKRINTLFLNGKAVDNVDTAIVKEGATLALSASMPGFVGAAFRRGGYYAAMRDNVSHVEGGESEQVKKGLVTLKLFNMTGPELGPLLLGIGVCLEARALKEFFADRPADFWRRCRTAKVNGQSIDPKDLREGNWSKSSGLVLLRVVSASPEDTPTE